MTPSNDQGSFGGLSYSIGVIMIENSAQGLTLLDAAHTVVVTGVEHHQPALAAWAPVDDQPRQVAAELCIAVIAHGPAAGRRGIEVRLDGWRVGELTLLLSERYLSHVDEMLSIGGRPGCVALVANGPRGLEMELRLPDVTTEATTALRALPAEPLEPEPRHRTPYLIGAGVLALLLAVGVAVGGGSGEQPSTSRPTVVAAPPPTSADPEPSAVPLAPPAPEDGDAAETVARRAPARPQAPTPPPPPEPVAPEPVVAAPAQPPAVVVTTTPPPPPREGTGLFGGGRPPEDPDGPFASCAEADAAGANDVPRSDPRYDPALDEDGDGVACEST